MTVGSTGNLVGKKHSGWCHGHPRFYTCTWFSGLLLL